MDYAIRDMRQDEFPLLEEFLYQAIWVPEGFEGEVPRSIVREDPKCRVAFEGFGTFPDDRAVVAELSGEVVGTCWVRTTDEYGHIDNAMPSFSISHYAAHRGNGIGTALMQHMISRLKKAGYDRAALSVQKTNPAVRLYQRLGFTVVGNGFDETEWLMVIPLCKPATPPRIIAASSTASCRLSISSRNSVTSGCPIVQNEATWKTLGFYKDEAVSWFRPSFL